MWKKYIVSLLIAVCFTVSMLVFPVSAATDSGTYGDNITWTYDSDTKTITFSGTGTLTGLPSDASDGYMKYCLDVRHIVVAEGFTAIADNSFPRGVFYGVESIRIADSVETIGRYAFGNYFKMKRLYLGKELKTIGESAFTTCESLEYLVLPAGLQYIGVEAFSLSGIKELVIPEGITLIEGGAFRSSRNLTRIVIPTSVKRIKEGAFRDCVSLTDVYYPGTQAQWEAIVIEHNDEIVGDATTGANTPLATATIHYNTAAFSHTHAWDSGKVTKVATCAGEGEKTYTCIGCPETKTETIAKTTQHTWDSGTKNADTTVTYKCTLCTATKTEGTPVTERPTQPEETKPTEPEETKPTETEEEKDTVTTPTEETTAKQTEETTGEDQKTTSPTESADDVLAVGPSDPQPKQPKEFPWVAVCIGAGVLIAAAGVIVWIRIRKKA